MTMTPPFTHTKRKMQLTCGGRGGIIVVLEICSSTEEKKKSEEPDPYLYTFNDI